MDDTCQFSMITVSSNYESILENICNKMALSNGHVITEGARKMVALITGITGQDGSYLAELLLEKVTLFDLASKSEICHNTYLQRTLYWLVCTALVCLRYQKMNPTALYLD